MATIDIFAVQPHQVSRDLRGYSVFLYGGWKTGKTTIAAKFPKALLLAFEKGYAAIPGVMALPINSWSDFKRVLRQLKEPQAQEMYETIIIDTADIAYDLCTKYICANNNADSVSDIPYGKGYGMIEKEFDEALRSIVQLNFGLVIISHDTDKVFTDESKQQYNKIVPTLDKRANNICARLCDIIGYSRSVEDTEGNLVTKLFMRGTPRYEAGSRFKYTPDVIDFTYQNLVNAIADAIDQQMAEEGQELFTDKRENTHEVAPAKDFDTLMAEFNAFINNLVKTASDEEMTNYWSPRIQQVTDRYLGKGNKVGNMNRDQVEALSLIIDDLKEIPNPS